MLTITEEKLHDLLEKTKKRAQDPKVIEEILKTAKQRALLANSDTEYIQGLTEEQAATLLNIDSSNQELMDLLFHTALEIKEKIYGNRIVIFAPLYVSNYCSGSCLYCGFRCTNKEIERKSLTDEELTLEVEELQKKGHKRLLMLMGDHPKYSFSQFLQAVELAASVKTKPHGEIRRINVEIPSLTIEQFKQLKATGKIGTYTLFQETYHLPTYKKVHPFGPKKDYHWRLNTMDRALQADMDDVGIGALFGLYDYRFEVLSLLKHAKYLDKTYGIGPHTISIPRIQPAINTPYSFNPKYAVNDLDFKKLVAVIRVSVPYTGMILTTRESPQMRKDLYQIGVSQISAGSKVEPGAYQKEEKEKSGQFCLQDMRPVNEVIYDLVKMGFVPSWCTACYRLKRTGKAFMAIAKKGEIQNCCHPNALLTFAEYLIDYADEKTKEAGWATIEKEIPTIKSTMRKEKLIKNLEKIKNGTRDLYF